MPFFDEPTLPEGEVQLDPEFAWLTGVLEAEGTFLRPIPSEPRLPIVTCQMTDRDVIERVATLFGTTVTSLERGDRRTIYATRVKGSRAVRLMRDLAPRMGRHRRRAIASALSCYEPPARKLSFESAEAIRERHRHGDSISNLARASGVARASIRGVLNGSIHRVAEPRPWRQTHVPRLGPSNIADVLSACELHWLAGWLEGEGSFQRPPPSDPRRARILGSTCDADVAHEGGRLLQTEPLLSHDERDRGLGWSPRWRLLKRGGFAVEVMTALRPLMGSRRQAQISAALEGVAENESGGGGSCTRVRGACLDASTSVPVESDLGAG